MSYKYNGDIEEISVTQTNFGKYIGYSQQKISQMMADSEIVRDESDKSGRVMLADSLREYYLSKRASGDNVNYWKEKALREQVNRKLDELKLQAANNEVYDASKIEDAFTTMLITLRNNLMGLPSKLSMQLENQSREYINEVMTREIEIQLKELSEHDFR